MGHGVAQELLDQHADAGVERGGEEHPLTTRRCLRQQALDRRQEAQVGHVVGLVQHGDLDVAQAAVPLLDQIFEPARSREKNVDSGTQRPHLRLLTHPAKDRDAGQAGDLGQRLER